MRTCSVFFNLKGLSIMENTTKQGKIRRFTENFSLLRGNLLILAISWMIWFPALRLTDAYAQPYIKELGTSEFIIGAISSIATVTLAIVRILGGYVADRFGRKNILTIMSFAISSSYLIYAFAQSWQWILIAATLNSVFLLYQPAVLALRADSVPPEKRGFGFALSEWLPGIISIPAPIIATYLVVTNGTVGGMRIAYFAAFALGTAAAVVRLFLKETLPQRKDKQKSTRKFTIEFSDDAYSTEAIVYIMLILMSVVGAFFQNSLWLFPGGVFFLLLLIVAVGRAEGVHSDFVKEYSEAIRFIFKNMRNVALLYILFNFAYLGASTFFSLYAIYFIQLGNENWGIMYIVSYISYLALLVPIGLLVDKLGRRNMLLSSITFLTLFSLVFALTPPNTPYTLLLLIITYSTIVSANTAYVSTVGTLEADYIPREKRGRVIAALAFVASLAGAIGQALAGFEYNVINQRFPFIVLTAFMALSFFVVLLKIKEPKTREQ